LFHNTIILLQNLGLRQFVTSVRIGTLFEESVTDCKTL